jgi:hypothetical protein
LVPKHHDARNARRRRRWYTRRDILFIAVVVAIWVGWNAYGRFTSPDRMSSALQAELAKGPEQLDLLVTAKFPPERFQSNVYIKIGVQRGTEGHTTRLVRVAPSDVRWLARQYWIDIIDLAPPSER